MSRKIGFDHDLYIKMQSAHIAERREEIGGRLYLEMGGKLYDDMHASRVLPGFTPDNKISMLRQLKDEIEILVCVSALDLQRQKRRADLDITYEDDVLRLIDVFREGGFLVENVVMTQLADDNAMAFAFKERLERLGLKVARHRIIEGYPSNTKLVLSEDGFGRNDYVEVSRDLIVVTAPGPGSGKLATCLSQVYHDNKRGIEAGYAKFETFPIWNLPLEHPVNLAYLAATADLEDINLIDPYHLAAHGVQATSYNRDTETFPLLKTMLEQLTGKSPYQSPTDMGVNMAGYCISDDEVCQEAARQEIIRRYYKALGFYWGDVSLSNTLFRRDAGAFAAYLVDAETGELHPEGLTYGQRSYDVEIARVNIIGELMDLQAGGTLDEAADTVEIGNLLQDRYDALWDELTSVETFSADETWRIEERIRRLNDLGFDVGELKMKTDTADGARQLLIQPKVVDSGHYHRQVMRLTGLDVQENQGRRMINDMQTFRMLNHLENVPLDVVAHRWLTKVYEPILAALPEELLSKLEPAQVFHEILDHRWYLSENRGKRVNLHEAIDSYIRKVLPEKPDEITIMGE